MKRPRTRTGGSHCGHATELELTWNTGKVRAKFGDSISVYVARVVSCSDEPVRGVFPVRLSTRGCASMSLTSYQTTFVAVKSILRALLFRSDSRNEDHQKDQQVRRRSGSPNRCIQRKVCGGGVFQRPGHVHGAVRVIPMGNEPMTWSVN